MLDSDLTPSETDAEGPDADALGVTLRDRFFAHGGDGADAETIRSLAGSVDPAPIARIEGLGLSYFPGGRFTALRFVEAERIDATVRSRFARPCAALPRLAGVFVDPEEFSFRTFENIVPLDRWFASIPLDLSLTDATPLEPSDPTSGLLLCLAASPEDLGALTGLDDLALYLPPMNLGSRGGKRFVFHAAALGAALTRAVASGLPEAWLEGFSHVNPVFRCNRFEPGDRPFASHVDTPYHDAARDHVSRYTLLIYLTGGTGPSALRIGEEGTVETMAPMTAVIFDQQRPHEGHPYVDGPKVFLRTELIFEDPSIVASPKVAALFARATYLSGEVVFAPELAPFTHEAYERAALAHWRGPSVGSTPEIPFVHKTYRGIGFLANGYDFWFPRGGLSLEECAALTLLDVLNCTIDGRPFRTQCTTEILVRDAEDRSWIPDFLASLPEVPSDQRMTRLPTEVMFPPAEDPAPEMCCPFHGPFVPSRADEIIDLYERAQGYAKRRILPSAIVAMGQEIFLDPDRFQIRGDQIHISSPTALAPVNFAACWNYGGRPDNYLGVEGVVDAPHLVVPPILFTETEGGIHLMFDLFRNAWMVDHTARRVPVPRILDRDDAEEVGDTPWFDALGPDGVEGSRQGARQPWWCNGLAVMDELYDDAE